MVRIEKEYVLDGPQGPAALAALFGDSRQLIIQHIMFGPDWDAACPSCTNAVDELSGGLLAHLRARDTAFALVSQALGWKPEAGRFTCSGSISITSAISATTNRPGPVRDPMPTGP